MTAAYTDTYIKRDKQIQQQTQPTSVKDHLHGKSR